MKRCRGPITPGYVRRTSPTACSVMPFTGSSTEEMEQLRWLARQYARNVPFGMDWPLNFWAERIGFDSEDHAARCWLLAYHNRKQEQSVACHGNQTRH